MLIVILFFSSFSAQDRLRHVDLRHSDLSRCRRGLSGGHGHDFQRLPGELKLLQLVLTHLTINIKKF